jgi:hypothetical protein
LRGVHLHEDPPVGVVALEGLGLLVVDLQAVPDRVCSVVLALDERSGVLFGVLGRRVVLGVVDVAGGLARAAAREALDEQVVRGLEGHRGLELGVYLLEHLVEGFRLGLVAGEAVQDPGVFLVQVGPHHLDDDLVRDQVPAVVVLLYLLPELGAGLDLGAHQVARRDVLRTRLARDALRLRPLACPLGAE